MDDKNVTLVCYWHHYHAGLNQLASLDVLHGNFKTTSHHLLASLFIRRNYRRLVTFSHIG